MAAGAVLLLAGCPSRPRAPVLRDDPVYQNDVEGFRFLAPEGWAQSTRADVPPGKATTERPLVEYHRKAGGKASSFRVSMMDLPPSADLAARLAGASYGASKWAPIAPPEEIAVGSSSGVRHVFTGRVGGEERVKEVVRVRRGERVYFFTGLYTPKDYEARDQLRRVVDSIIWKN
jgi:hypothetical protein